MYLNQSTIESQSEEIVRKLGKNIRKLKMPKRLSKRKKQFQQAKYQSKIQIQQSESKASFSPEVKVYVQDIMRYIVKQESGQIITENYMQWQPQINTPMREILVGWLIEVSTSLNLKLQTLHLAVLLVDKFCHSKPVNKNRYQVLGAASLFIASKFEQITTPKLERYLGVSDGAYNREQLLAMESEILLTLKFAIKERSTLTFFEIKSKQYGISKNLLRLGEFILEMTLVEYEFCRKKPTYLSLAILYFVQKIQNNKVGKVKIFVGQNDLDEDIFSTHLGYIQKLFTVRHYQKYTAIRKRYSNLFDKDFNLKSLC